MKKNLIIVCEERLRHYGDFLAQLMSSSSDAEGQIVALRGNTAAAQVWTEKEYTSNAAQISSEQYILFIGNSTLIKEKRMHMHRKYSEYGMNYGWLGKQGVLFVDRLLSYAEYEEFYKLLSSNSAECNQPEATRLIEAKAESGGQPPRLSKVKIEDVAVEDVDESCEEERPAEKENKLKKFLDPFEKNTKTALMKTVDFGAKQFDRVSRDFSIVKNGKNIEAQEYTCLVLMFYLKDLGTFLGFSEA